MDERAWEKFKVGEWFFEDSPNCTNRYSVMERTNGGTISICSTCWHHAGAKKDMQEIARLHNAALAANATPAQPESKTCPDCGREIHPSGQVFCGHDIYFCCNKVFGYPRAPEAPLTPPAPRPMTDFDKGVQTGIEIGRMQAAPLSQDAHKETKQVELKCSHGNSPAGCMKCASFLRGVNEVMRVAPVPVVAQSSEKPPYIRCDSSVMSAVGCRRCTRQSGHKGACEFKPEQRLRGEGE